MAFHWSTQLAFNESSVQRLGLSCTSNIVHLHGLQTNFSNNSLLNGVYGLNLPPWPSKPFTLVVRHISLTSCNITNLQDVCTHSILISFQSPVTAYLLNLVLFDFCSYSLEFTTYQHPRISVTSYLQTSAKDILLSVSLPYFNCPPCLEYLCLRALILLRLWHCINHLLTYLLTYLLTTTLGSSLCNAF